MIFEWRGRRERRERKSEGTNVDSKSSVWTRDRSPVELSIWKNSLVSVRL